MKLLKWVGVPLLAVIAGAGILREVAVERKAQAVKAVEAAARAAELDRELHTAARADNEEIIRGIKCKRLRT
jgi:ATP-dependent exoDNAse (exonuclease V) alpha subunit